MKKGFILVSLLVCLFMQACSVSRAPDNLSEITIYYASADITWNKGLAIGHEPRQIEPDADRLGAALNALTEKPRSDELKSPFPDGVRLVSYNINGGTIELYMSDAYADMPEGAKAVARACLTLTLCAIDGIEAVSVFVGDIPDVSGLAADDILIKNTEPDPHIKRVKLYFATTENDLGFEYREVAMRDDKGLAACVMEELLEGPRDEGYYSPIPEGTKLLSLAVEGWTCVIDLSDEFLENKPDTEVGGALTIYSIVNSLTELTSVDRVQFLVNGQKVEEYLGIEISNPLTSRGEIIA